LTHPCYIRKWRIFTGMKQKNQNGWLKRTEFFHSAYSQIIFQKLQGLVLGQIELKFIYSEKAKKFCEISMVDLSFLLCSNCQIYGGDFANFCHLWPSQNTYRVSHRFVLNFAGLQLWFQFLTFLIALSKETINKIKT
jgi:hypothetical protein